LKFFVKVDKTNTTLQLFIKKTNNTLTVKLMNTYL